jgi:hypothetical protein
MVKLKQDGKRSSQQCTTSVSSAILVDNPSCPKEEPMSFAKSPNEITA